MIVLLSVVALAYCYSNGEIDECNATSPLFGCKTWKITNGVEQRVDGCLDANADKLIMDWYAGKKKHRVVFTHFLGWCFFLTPSCRPRRVLCRVSKPVRSDLYELFAGSEDAKLTKYIPGQRLPIGLRVKKFQGNYRGILLYALDDKGQKIGTWSFIDRVTTFHQFEACPNSVLHVNGVVRFKKKKQKKICFFVFRFSKCRGERRRSRICSSGTSRFRQRRRARFVSRRWSRSGRPMTARSSGRAT